jgi:hypothetical protein
MRYIVATLIALNLLFLYFNFSGETATEIERTMPLKKDSTASIQLLREAGTSRKRQMEQVVNNPVQLVEEVEEVERVEEVGEVEDAGDVEEVERVAEVAEIKEKETNCKAVGPFSSLTTGQSVLERLLSMDLVVQLKALDSLLDEYYYRVLIPPVESLEVAFRNLRELQSLGIDSYVITQGEDSLGISMGVYSTALRAEEVRQKLSKDGYPTNVRQVSRIAREYWIFSLDGGDLDVREEVMKSIQSKYPNASYGLQNCVKAPQELEE